jgi:four helix bundle protein
LQIWQRAADLGVALDELSEILDERRKYKFAEQLRSAALSISNNIAEGSGSNSNADFRRFLYIARKSAFESASMLLLLTRRQYFNDKQVEPHIADLDSLCRMIVSFADKLD